MTAAPARPSGGFHYTIEAPAQVGTDALRQPDLLAVARRNILSWLETAGEAPLAEMPRSWPVTRFMMREAAGRLEAEGAIVAVRDPVTGQKRAWRLAETTGRS